MNYGKLSHDYSKCSPAIRATAEVASAIHRLADVFFVVAESLALGSRAQAAATEVFGRHLELLSATLTTAVASNAEHSRELGRRFDDVANARSEVEAVNAELAKTRDSLRYAHRRIEQLQASTHDKLLEDQPDQPPTLPIEDLDFKTPKRKKGKSKTPKRGPQPEQPEADAKLVESDLTTCDDSAAAEVTDQR